MSVIGREWEDERALPSVSSSTHGSLGSPEVGGGRRGEDGGEVQPQQMAHICWVTCETTRRQARVMVAVSQPLLPFCMWLRDHLRRYPSRVLSGGPSGE
ncbi:hypothetical protein Pmani_037601 [Petrolisthes manimaculis]|uniref:Uncharacterized protein n=1 Tax=Petrolisthes manimaculis TaxID=1843537 RepID=A0AAE1NHV7_9EUCA|nr:hypothetical protein Pmani_037601 [Petrolisthes manimaculis]